MGAVTVFTPASKWLLDRVGRRACLYDSEAGIAIVQDAQRIKTHDFTVWSRVAIAISLLLAAVFFVRTRSIPLSVLMLLLCVAVSEAVLCDLVARVIPKECCWAIALLGAFLQLAFGGVQGLLSGVVWALVLCALMYGLASIFGNDEASGSVGGGDLRLLFAICVACGKLALPAVLLGIGAAALWGCIGICCKRLSKKDTFAFAPFLAAGISVLALV